MSGVIDRFPLLFPVRNPVAGYGTSAVTRTRDRGHVAYPELFASYGASAVTRTSGRGHVAEARTNVIEVSGLRVNQGFQRNPSRP